jgi:hypothetical protein
MTGTVNLYNIFYGDFISTTEKKNTRSLVDYFAKYVGGSEYLQVLSAYYQIVSGNITYASTNPVFKQSLTITPPNSNFSRQIAVKTI